MANRPVFLPSTSPNSFVEKRDVEFKWFPGMAVSQKQKSIASLHESAKQSCAVSKVLEISSKSPEKLGVQLSAFNLAMPIDNSMVTVEVLFQAGKEFASGGPFRDILRMSPREAKGDIRLKESGRLIAFWFGNERWPLSPTTAFYDWLYLRALDTNPSLAAALEAYDAFTDIEFNPEKSINCQARSAALYVALKRRGVLQNAMKSQSDFLDTLQGQNERKDQSELF